MRRSPGTPTRRHANYGRAVRRGLRHLRATSYRAKAYAPARLRPGKAQGEAAAALGEGRQPEGAGDAVNIKQLQYLVQIAEARSFSKAAVRLNVAQPALSRQIRLLEEELGVPLLHRTGRGATPTEAGRELVSRTLFLLKYLHDTREALIARRGVVSGKVRIGVIPIFGAAVIPHLLTRCKAQHPLLDVRVEIGMTQSVQEWIVSGRVDFGVISMHDEITKAVAVRPVVAAPLLLVAPRDDAPAGTGPVPLTEVLARRLVIPQPGHGIRGIIDRAARRVGAQVTPVLEVDSIEIIKALVLMGAGATVLPEFAVGKEIADGDFVVRPIADPVETYRAALANSLELPLTPSAAVVADLIAELSAGIRGACPAPSDPAS